MEARPGRVAARERDAARRRAGRTSIRADRARAVAVAAQEVADAGPVAAAERAKLRVRVPPQLVLDDELGVVLDPAPSADGADQESISSPDDHGVPGAEAEPLVEAADALDELAAQEDRVRDPAVPDVRRA